ncbi:NAD(P)/FAD-dependent oxidoreductase [Devosia sp.]|uniref:NAD(P)/FAD-dependent oxidoreductase n=1 Tax=Devosia sp. TaxID=1871048 RepID=UPI002F214929
MTQSKPIDVVIVGAGIVGLAAAFKLQQAGRTVLLVDRTGMAEETSRGNAGGLAFSDVLPMATSGVLRKLPRWLSDPLGPLTIPPAYLLPITPWLIRFWRAGWPDRVKASIAAQSALMRLAASEMASLVQDAGLADMIRADGVLELYESEAELAASEPGWSARKAEGIGFEHVRGAELAALQPGLSPRFVAGTFIPAWQTVSDPYDFALAIGSAVQARGGALHIAEVRAVTPAAGGVDVQLADGERISAAKAVIAGGAWSKGLAAALGDEVPLETERGYNTTLPPGSFDLKRQLTFGGHGFVVTPLTSGIRVGGAVELGGLALPPNFARADAMLRKAKAFLPDLRVEGGKQWMGFRPSLPDSLPVIGASRRSPDVVYAFGHGHLGLTQSAATGRLVADLVTGATPPIDLAPFAAQRF